MKLAAVFASALALLGTAGIARAHAVLNTPQPLTNDDDAKSGPCGCYFGTPETPGEDDTPSECPAGFTTTPLVPGSQVTVKWVETVNHNGAFRIAWSPLPVGEVTKADLEAGILYDEPDMNSVAGATLETTITIPDADCPACTLQLRQFMETTYYYSCASVSILGGAGTTGGMGAGGGGQGGAGQGGDIGNGATSGAGNGVTSGGDSTGPGMGPQPGDNPTDAGGCSVAVPDRSSNTPGGLAAVFMAAIAGFFARRRRARVAGSRPAA